MKIKVRIGIYETNSSSSHSFIMGPSGRFDSKLTISKSGVIRVSGDAWTELRSTNDPYDKLSYLLCFIDSISNTKKEAKSKREKVYDVILDFTGARRVIYDNSYDERVDHQSLDIIDSRDLEDPEFIKEFVFNDGTWLYLLWDSDDPGKDYYIKTDANQELYQLEFDLPGLQKTTITLDYDDSRSPSHIYDRIEDILSDIYYDPVKKIFKKCENRKETFGCLTWGGWRSDTPFEFVSSDLKEKMVVCPKIVLIDGED